MGIFNENSKAGGYVRRAAVAGQFYPADAGELKTEVEKHLRDGRSLNRPARLMIVPHAGYIFSGPIAGKGYATIDRFTRTVILLGPPHQVPLRGVAAVSVSHFETPLGKIPVDRERVAALLENPLVKVDDRAHAPEHCLEVQLPFLQMVMESFSIVPLLVHGVDPETVAGLLEQLIDDHTVVVASSDLSHYLPQRQAKTEDRKSIEAILSGETAGEIDACGEMPIRVVMSLAKRTNMKPTLLDARTSFETCPRYGSADRVVGYASIVYLSADDSSKKSGKSRELREQSSELTGEVKDYLLSVARKGLEASVKGESYIPSGDMPPFASQDRGCFVTLTVNGRLRGCIGYIEPIKPLYLAVAENARNAALADPRFAPVAPEELSFIMVEVSVLTTPEPIDYSTPGELLEKLVPGVDGIILRKDGRQSTFLPQVWEQLPDKVGFLEQLSLKAGMPKDGWKTSQVKRYRAEHFCE